MNILITGSKGLIGSALKEFYTIRGHNIQDFNRWHYKDYRQKGWSFAEYVNDFLEFMPDLIINCAAEIYNNEQMYDINTRFVVEDIVSYLYKYPRTKLIHIGSSSEYGKCDYMTSESDPLKPFDEYSGTKAATSMLLQGIAVVNKFDIKIIRPYSIFGPGEKPNKFMRFLFNAFENNKKIDIFRGSHDWVYVDDFVQAFDKVLESHTKKFDVINIGSGMSCSNNEVYEIFCKIYNKYDLGLYIDRFYNKNDCNYWCCDAYYSESAYGIRVPDNTLVQGIEKMIEILKQK